jgi:internalin A
MTFPRPASPLDHARGSLQTRDPKKGEPRGVFFTAACHHFSSAGYFLLALLCLAAPLSAAPGWIESLGGSVTTDARGVLTGVNLRGSWVTDTDLRRLADYPELNTLDLSLTHITDEGMTEIRNLRNVTDLNLYYAEYVTDQGIAAIKNWKKLKRLNLHGTKSSDTALEHIAGITSLESLDVGSIMMTDVGLERLTTLTNLKELTMGANELGDAGLQALRQLPTLTYLDLTGRQGMDKNVWTIVMSAAGLDAVLSLQNMRELRIGCYAMNVGIEEAKLAEVTATAVLPEWLDRMRAKLANLEAVGFQGCGKINDASVKTLAAMPKLKEADLRGTSVTEKGAAALRAAKPGVKVWFGPWEAKAANYRNN